MPARKNKTNEPRQRAFDMYVRGAGLPPAPAAQPAAQPEDAFGLEVLVPDTLMNDDTPVASEDAVEMGMASRSEYGTLGSDDVDPAIDVEPQPEAPQEAAAAPAPESEAYLLDAWHAVFSDPGQRALAIQQQTEARESVLEVVIGTDDRVRVTNVTAFPWRVICSLLITARDGSNWIGTGWLIGRRTLITAGHCVYIKDRGGWVTQIEVIPGRNASDRPYGSVAATKFRSVAGWTQKTLRSHDYAAIILPDENPYGDELGYFGIANLEDTQLNQLMVNLSGYPGDKPPGTHWFHARQISAVTPTYFAYDIDTAGGQSGAPVWRLMNGQRHVVGIHTNGSPTGNSATRINKAVFDNLMLWKADGD